MVIVFICMNMFMCYLCPFDEPLRFHNHLLEQVCLINHLDALATITYN